MNELVYGVVGTGAIGGFYGGILADAGSEVHFLLHNDYEYVKANGLIIDSKVFGTIKIKKHFYNSTKKMPKCDVILVGLKTTQNHLLKDLLKPLLKRNSLVILIQNGLGMEEDLQQELPDVKIGGGVAYIAAYKEQPGVVVHQDMGTLMLAIYNETNDDAIRTFFITEDFTRTNKITCAFDYLNTMRWQKLVWNIPFNGLSVVLNEQTDTMIFDLNTRSLAKQLMEEVVRGAAKCRVRLPDSIVADSITLTEEMNPYSPSMKLDFNNHRPMEIKYMYERPVEIALKAGFRMSKVETLAKLLRAMEEKGISHLTA